jgi:hypothetical protein
MQKQGSKGAGPRATTSNVPAWKESTFNIILGSERRIETVNLLRRFHLAHGL